MLKKPCIKKINIFFFNFMYLREPFHLFVLVHGFQGNSFDMRLFKNLLNVRFSNAHFICSSSNEDNTEGDIADMGKNLANEVKKYIIQWCPTTNPERSFFSF